MPAASLTFPDDRGTDRQVQATQRGNGEEVDAGMDAAVTPFTRLSADAARVLAVETLLADPDALDDDVLETCLYLLRERLRASSLAR
jgi:hypothetical protein